MSYVVGHHQAWTTSGSAIVLLGTLCAVAGLLPTQSCVAQTTQPTTRNAGGKYGFIRYSLPEGWPVGRRYSSLCCDMPGLPEGKYYRLFITDSGPAGADLLNYYEQAFKDLIPGSPGRNGLKPLINTSPDGQTTVSQTLVVRMRNGESAHVSFSLLIMDGVSQCVGVITNDEQFWKDNLKHKEAFEASLSFDHDALLSRPYRSVSSPALRAAATRPSAEETEIKNVVEQFMQATWAGDEKALYTQIMPLQEGERTRVRLLLEENRQRLKLEQLVFSRFPKEQCAADWPEPDPAEQLQHMLDALQKATATLNADTATVQLQRSATPIELRRLGGFWRVDLVKFLQQRNEFRLPRWRQETETQAKAAADTAAAIERGELKSVRAARDAFESRMGR